MAVIDERWDTRSGQEGLGLRGDGSAAVIYVVDALTATQAVQEASDVAPLNFTLPLGRLVLRKSFEWEPADGDLWYVTVHYSHHEPQTSEGFDFNFDTTGGSAKRTQAIQNKGNYAHPESPFPAPDFHGAIGVTDQGIEGVDVPIRTFKWSETHVLPLEAVTFGGYAEILELLTGTKNAASFRSRPARACIFHGAQGGKKDAETAEITYHFEAGRHISGGTFGPFTGVDKEAWDYLWFTYIEEEDTEAKKIVKRPISCHVDEVIESGDWGLLGIGS